MYKRTAGLVLTGVLATPWSPMLTVTSSPW
jgi:hypothetical protein